MKGRISNKKDRTKAHLNPYIGFSMVQLDCGNRLWKHYQTERDNTLAFISKFVANLLFLSFILLFFSFLIARTKISNFLRPHLAF